MDRTDQDSTTSLEAAGRGDRFTFAYTLLTLPVFLLVAFSGELDRAFNLFLLLVPLLLFPGFLLLVILTVCLVFNLGQRRWRHVLSVLLAPVLAAAPLVLCSYLGVGPTWLRFQLERAYYEREVARLEQQAGVPRLTAFDRGGTGGAGSVSMDYTLVYDESDEVAMPPSRRSPGWTDRANREPRLRSIVAGDGKPFVRSLGSHFYEVTQAY